MKEKYTIEKGSIFQKLAVGLILMFVLIILIFWWIYQLNVQETQRELQKNKLGEVRFMSSQLSNQFEQVLVNALTLAEDQSVRGYTYVLRYGNDFAKYKAKLELIEKLALNSASTSWNNTIILYYPDEQDTVSSDPQFSFRPFAMSKEPLDRWMLHMNQDGTGYYSHLTKGHRGPMYIEIRISLDVLQKMMSEYTSGTPMLYDARFERAIRGTGSAQLAGADAEVLPHIRNESGTFEISFQHTNYFISFMKASILDLYFIDYHPTDQLRQSISSNNTWFVLALVVMLLLSLFYILALRNQVQQPIIRLRKAIDRFDRGDYSSRVDETQIFEFKILGRSFNRMAENTQTLIEQVLLGELSVKEARLKQYQAQINPHFLYNCLNFIQSKSSIKDYESVTAMTLELASYCRYIHRIEDQDSTLGEELRFVNHYMSIIHMRKQSITFETDVPSPLLSIRIPRMILQPLVENGVKHGIEPSMASGQITIHAEQNQEDIRIFVQDNGVGMSADRLARIRAHMDEFTRPEEQIGTGIRNVNQRLKLTYGKRSGLSVDSSLYEGTRCIITIHKEDIADASDPVSRR
ncbi:histidine kinase [Paenibacillus barcinonensis]|uniref:Histidine kinase n=1 Tax=Paenibacillus barcinonensis TaxID=198119 RepID=A0A2V4WCX1_PAEBA|nr:histidine kinase [Paenibacillus barcinonensis]PYE45444.1 two-component system sensor histidine kinase YesM [Paenibacillus barcinonensis]QKS55259.1 histidine kinase [Paenibacillus barcinonensis]